MAIEAADFISELSPTDPPFNDPLGEADDHTRLIKKAVQQSFPNIDAAVTSTPTEINGWEARIATIEANIIEGATKMLFMQASAPTGWTIDAGFNNRALKIASSGGGGLAGTHAFSSIFQSSAWSTSVVANHDHGIATSAAVSSFGGVGYAGGGGAHIHNITADGSHGHTSDLRVQYAVGTVCTKGAY